MVVSLFIWLKKQNEIHNRNSYPETCELNKVFYESTVFEQVSPNVSSYVDKIACHKDKNISFCDLI